MKKLCLRCSEPVKDRHATYCSFACFTAHANEKRIDDWLSGCWDGATKYGLSDTIRNYLLAQANYACRCGWGEINPFTEVSPLQINHIDGNAENNRPSNIEVLCPNCHSLTSNFGNLNRGNGRNYRYAGYEPISNRKMRSPEEKAAIITLLELNGTSPRRWSEFAICECGNLMIKSSKRCNACRRKAESIK